MLAFLQANWGIVATILWAASELLAAIPAVKANSVFQLVFGWLASQKSG